MNEVIDKVKKLFLKQLASRQWVQVAKLRDAIPDSVADQVEFHGPLAYEEAGKLETGRHKVTRDVVEELVESDVCESRRCNGGEEIRLIAEPPATRQALSGEGPPDVHLPLVPTGSVGASASPPGDDGNVPTVARDGVAESPSATPPAGDFDYPLHDVVKIFPLMCEEAFQALKEHIRLHGLLEAIWIYQGQVVEGRHRSRACRELGIRPTFQEWDGRGGSLIEFVVSKNAHRRHQTKSQLACVAVEVEARLAQPAKERQRAHGGTAPKRKAKNTPGKNSGSVAGDAREQAAKMVGVNARYVSDAKRLKKERPDLFDRVFSGELELAEALQLAFPKKARAQKPSQPSRPRSSDSPGTGPGRDEQAARAGTGHPASHKPDTDGNGVTESAPVSLLGEGQCWTPADLAARLETLVALAPTVHELIAPSDEQSLHQPDVSRLIADLNEQDKNRFAEGLYHLAKEIVDLASILNPECDQPPAQDQTDADNG